MKINTKELEQNFRWQFIKLAFEGVKTPDAFLIGHQFMGIDPITCKKIKAITNEEWQDFSRFCDMCDIIANLRNSGLDKESCLSLWMSYKVGGFTSASPTSKKEGMELSLNPIPSQINNKNNNGSGIFIFIILYLLRMRG